MSEAALVTDATPAVPAADPPKAPLPTLKAYGERMAALEFEKKIAAVINIYQTHPLEGVDAAKLTAEQLREKAAHASLFEAVLEVRDEALRMLNGAA